MWYFAAQLDCDGAVGLTQNPIQVFIISALSMAVVTAIPINVFD